MVTTELAPAPNIFMDAEQPWETSQTEVCESCLIVEEKMEVPSQYFTFSFEVFRSAQSIKGARGSFQKRRRAEEKETFGEIDCSARTIRNGPAPPHGETTKHFIFNRQARRPRYQTHSFPNREVMVLRASSLFDTYSLPFWYRLNYSPTNNL